MRSATYHAQMAEQRLEEMQTALNRSNDPDVIGLLGIPAQQALMVNATALATAAQAHALLADLADRRNEWKSP